MAIYLIVTGTQDILSLIFRMYNTITSFSSSTFLQCFNHSSSDIKMAAAQMINHAAMTTESPLDMSIVRGILVVLVSNTKDKNTAVQADSEWALVALLKLKHGDEFLQVRWREKKYISRGQRHKDVTPFCPF